MRRTILAVLLGTAISISIATPAHAVGVPTAPPKAIAAAIGPTETWHRFVETRVNFRLDREILYRLSIGHDVIDGRVDVTERSPESIHLTAWFLAVDNRGIAYIGAKRCFAWKSFGGGDFPRPRVIHCAPEGRHNWPPQ